MCSLNDEYIFLLKVHVALLDGGEGVAMQLKATQDRVDEKPETTTIIGKLCP